jgi:hypothetical protein
MLRSIIQIPSAHRMFDITENLPKVKLIAFFWPGSTASTNICQEDTAGLKTVKF